MTRRFLHVADAEAPADRLSEKIFEGETSEINDQGERINDDQIRDFRHGDAARFGLVEIVPRHVDRQPEAIVPNRSLHFFNETHK